MAWQDFHSHKWMYDEESLRHLMRGAGFAEIERKEYAESGISNIAYIEDASRIEGGAGVCLEGRKRAADRKLDLPS